MSFHIYNTLTRQLEEFVPLKAPQVRLYTCGPTVYDFAHLGNFRAYVFEDLLRRTLRAEGFEVQQVMNLTDVDDKTIRGAQAAALELDDYTRQYKEAFFEDLRALAIEPAEHYPAATEHIAEMIALIEKLLQKGFAYRSEDGAVYFSIEKFKPYGKLAHLDRGGLAPGARIAQDEYQKENAADFALWKAQVPEDGLAAWDSPWGRGRPGWHIECSAMSMKYLGESFDLHTGGMDNIFPHHENEIAQSEAATGKPFVKYWMHCAHLIVDGRKMSKSAGNFYTLRDLLQLGFSGREIRYALLSVHYRQALNFTFEALTAARGALQRLDEFAERVQTRGNLPARLQRLWRSHCGQAMLSGIAGLQAGQLPEGQGPQTAKAEPQSKIENWCARHAASFSRALSDDLNISLALAALFDLVREGNQRLDAEALSPAQSRQAWQALAQIDRVLGVQPGTTPVPPEAVIHLAQERLEARRRKDFSAADRLRREVEAQGWIIQDTSED
ncbi:MAG: cysteine--tRNA ligase, partial [Lentisphaerae bacterium]|nr:cysteine--tRNA ligase [Lentisphaerota bacterium]